MDKYQSVLEDGEIEYLLFKPNVFRLYAKCYSKEERPPYFSRIIHHIRMIRELLFAKYEVVYLRKDERIIGHLVVSRGGTRIVMSNKEDIVIGPIWIVPKERGKGIASKAIGNVLHSMGYEYTYAYEYIESDNIASIRTVEKNDFEFVSYCSEYGLLKTIKKNENGKICVFRYEENKNR